MSQRWHLPILLAALLAVAACTQAPPTPTPNIEATVQSAIEKALPTATDTPEPDFQATVHAGVAGTMEVLASTPSPTPVPPPTATPIPPPTPTQTPIPTDTPTPIPTDTPTPIPTNTPTPTFTPIPSHTPTPTNTPPPTATHTPIPTDTPIPTETPTPIPTATTRFQDLIDALSATPTPTETPVPTPAHTPIPVPTSSPDLSVADVVERAREGVVRIEGPNSSGSGFVVDSDGYILTNEHVIRGQSRLTVVFDNGTRLTARVISSDAARDIALLKVTASRTLTVLPFAKSVRVGDEVLVLGYPLGYQLGDDMTANDGIVSSLRTYSGVSYIQTNAAINPGNSGGPLVNLKGEVVGMNTSSIDESRSGRPVEGIGFAIKFDVLSSRITAMKSGGGSSPAPTSTPVTEATQTPGYVFGPESGSIEHDPEDGFIDTYRASVSVSDAIIEARFFNPYSKQTGKWSSGFIFRRADANVVHIVVVNSNGAWYHYLRTGDVDTQQDLAAEFSNHINTDRNGSNHIRIIANGPDGWLFINGAFIANLDLSGLTSTGSVSAVGSYFQSDGLAGRSTRFEDFTIRSLRKVYGPREGEITHDPDDGSIDAFNSRVSLTDGIIEARFINPYGSSLGEWSSGFLFRHPRTNEFHAIVINQTGSWFHDLRLGNADNTQDLASRYSSSISTTSSGNNLIRFIALGNEGWLFINGQYMEKLDLSGLNRTGRVSAVAGYYTGDGIVGYSTRFEDFTIWSAD